MRGDKVTPLHAYEADRLMGCLELVAWAFGRADASELVVKVYVARERKQEGQATAYLHYSLEGRSVSREEARTYIAMAAAGKEYR
jgi:hypothetical protein